MAPLVLHAKLEALQQVLADLQPHVGADRDAQEDAHYEIERQVQLAVDLSVSMARRMLLLASKPVPESAREGFLALARGRLIPKELGRTLADAVGLRNLIVHEYGAIDYDLFFSGLKKGYKAFVRFSDIALKFLEKKS